MPRSSWATRHLPESTVLAAGLLLGIVLRAVQLATSAGTIDAASWVKFLLFINERGLLHSYEATPLLNHPTLSLEIALWTWRLGDKIGLAFFDSYRILMCIADVVTTFTLLAIARRIGVKRPLFIALVFFLSPIAIFISAFHCNSDPLLVMFIALSLLAATQRRAALAGLLIAAAIGIKIVALPVLMFLLLFFRETKERVRFALCAIALCAVIFVPPIIATHGIAARNIFGYAGWKSGWGFRLLFDLVHAHIATTFITAMLAIALIVVWLNELRRTMNDERLAQLTALSFLLVLFLGSGFGPQYMMWIAPFLAFALPRVHTVVLHALVSVFLLIVYTSWAGGWPWVWANAAEHPEPAWVAYFGLIVWAAIGWSAFVAARVLYRTKEAGVAPAS